MKYAASYFEMTHEKGDMLVKDGIGKVCPDKDKIIGFFENHASEYTALTCSSSDYISGESLDESVKCYSDGNYSWTNEEVYHFKKYDLKLNDDFIAYVLNQTSQKESA